MEIGTYSAPSCICPVNQTGGQCTAGFFCPSGSPSPKPCTGGYYCGTAGLAAESGQCYGGYYCMSGAQVPDPTDGTTGGLCPVGHYCPNGTETAQECLAGTYQNGTGKTKAGDCEPCTPGYYCSSSGLAQPTGKCAAGYYCPAGQTNMQPSNYSCTPGHYCPEGSGAEIECPSGQYQNATGQSTCKICDAGYYCDGILHNGVDTPESCQRGHYCPAGTRTAAEFPCPAGTYNNNTNSMALSACVDCDPGKYCGSIGLALPTGYCDSGYFCIKKASIPNPTDGTTGNICPEGSYCNPGSYESVECPSGTYNPTRGIGYLENCTDCEGGVFCSSPGLNAPVGNCSAGYYCISRATKANPTDNITGNVCPAGHYCPIGTGPAPLPCPHGKYTSITVQSQCYDCVMGKYCVDGINQVPCPQGFYCPTGTGQDWRPCPSGTYGSSTGFQAENQCTTCPARQYCGTTNLTAPSGLCDAGYYCKSGSDSSMPSNATKGDGGPCPIGHFCEQGTQDPTPCPLGTFGNQTLLRSAAECHSCTPGYYCDATGLTEPVGLCSEGFYCLGGSNSSNPPVRDASGGPCPAGKYCENGTSTPPECPSGTFQILEQKASCDPCPAGYYCLQGSATNTPCPEGYYCPQGTQFAHQYPCPNGTFNTFTTRANIDACVLCPAGKYCPSEGLADPAGFCSGGWYCTLGSWTDKPSILGNESGSDCHCPAQSIGGKCLAGTFCPNGSSIPTQCTGGYYCETDELLAVTGPCLAGYYCSSGSTMSNPVNETFGDICPKGHYCPLASQSAIPCPEGTFSDAYANENETNCLPCTAGMYCAGIGRALPNGNCTEGWFCPQGSTQPQPTSNKCLAGHECPEGSGAETPCTSGFYQPDVGMGACEICPAGKYCDQNEAITEQQSGVGEASHGVVTPKTCPAGFYCPAGTKTSGENPCPIGTYSNTTGISAENQCIKCDPGYYCHQPNMLAPAGKCNAGFHCTLSATSPSPTGNGSECEQGTFCIQGSSIPTDCPKGMFGSAAQLTSLTDCTFCTPGKYCDSTGLQQPAGNCLAGYYCSNASEEAAPVGKAYGDICPVGHYCPEQSYAPTACAAGTYQPFTGRTNVTACLACDPGSYCNATGQAQVTGDCSAGFYCILGATNNAPTDGIMGNICPIGSKCPLGSATHIFCPNGTYTNHTGASECYVCPAGSFCTSRDSAEPCPRGYYCPEGTGADIIPCPAGTYNPVMSLTQLSECTKCDGGKYCLLPGQDNYAGQCNAGYYCTSGVNTATPNSVNNTGVGGKCPTGYYCPTGSSHPLPCAAGTYSESEGKSACITCPASFYCTQNTTSYALYPCPAGYYCPVGTTHDRQYPCPKGYYNPVNGQDSSTDCLQCPGGKYCETDGLSTPTGDCAGWLVLYRSLIPENANRRSQHY
ncbi:hypothetical protein DPMN_115097 [Dreissena polymorpha]|uniref:Chitin-binding type-2 domain-containing protein n=2 Tax=Dreissena polymorpha TaxID=45954 RepID=A0A9D4KLF2_DREPO|nr:hypothetical protein DPMN_115097 [Dreissena polymorpha]